MSISYLPCRPVDGRSAYDVLVIRNGRDERVAHICYDKWTETWALLHTNGLIEKFGTLLGARGGVTARYGDASHATESTLQLADLQRPLSAPMRASAGTRPAACACPLPTG